MQNNIPTLYILKLDSFVVKRANMLILVLLIIFAISISIWTVNFQHNSHELEITFFIVVFFMLLAYIC